MKMKLIICHVCLITATVTSGCKKLIEIPPSQPGNIVTSQVFADSLSAINGVTGIYIYNFIIPGVLSSYVTIYPGLSADELVTQRASDAAFYNYNLIASAAGSPGGSASMFWTSSYGQTLIYQATAAIEGLEASNGISITLKNQLIGECKVTRALTYFNLVNMFGAVPLVTTSNYLNNDKIARTSPDSVYSFLVTDLTDASTRLPAAYFSVGRGRPNKYTALALLAKVQLYRKQWAAAEAAATSIINSGIYMLETDVNNVFVQGSQEAIWQVSNGLLPSFPDLTVEGEDFIPFYNGFMPTYYINANLINAFEKNDARRTKWIDSSTVNGVLYYYPYKYKHGITFPQSTVVDGYIIFRLADQYLIRAEARVEQGNLAGATADLNIIRNRAGLANTTATSADDLIKAILHERQIELFCEWGNRWFDLKRTGTASSVLSAEKSGIWPTDGHAELYPIPGDQIILDPLLTQNLGY